MFGNIFGEVFGSIFGFVKDHFEGERKIKLAKVEAEIAMASKKASAEIDWDLMWADQARHSWKDEWFVILHSIPVIMAFIPGLAPYVGAGFEVLANNAPDWFITFYGAGVAASFGIRGLKDAVMTNAKKNAMEIKASAK